MTRTVVASLGLVLALAACGSGSAATPAGGAPSAAVTASRAERRAAGAVAQAQDRPLPIAPGADRSVHSATAEDALRRVAAELGPYDGRPTPIGRADDGRFLTRVEVHAVAVSRWPAGAHATPAQRTAADRLVRATEAAARGFRDVSRAEAQGYRRVDEMHYVDEAAVRDGHVLDPAHPEALMYMDMGSAPPHLVGVMYLMDGRARGPQVGGPLTPWHYHLFGAAVCMVGGGFPVALADAGEHCEQGTAETRSPEMLHVWLGVGRDRVFSSAMDTVPRAHAHA